MEVFFFYIYIFKFEYIEEYAKDALSLFEKSSAKAEIASSPDKSNFEYTYKAVL